MTLTKVNNQTLYLSVGLLASIGLMWIYFDKDFAFVLMTLLAGQSLRQNYKDTLLTIDIIAAFTKTSEMLTLAVTQLEEGQKDLEDARAQLFNETKQECT